MSIVDIVVDWRFPVVGGVLSGLLTSAGLYYGASPALWRIVVNYVAALLLVGLGAYQWRSELQQARSIHRSIQE